MQRSTEQERGLVQGSTENSTLNTGLHNPENTRDVVQTTSENDNDCRLEARSCLKKL